ncbi:MAG TPA: DUF1697 domain-containing protein [Sphingomicrobium sp.]|jgi:uncharacterized protein (DUF1697 family)|nr:DUF1697 domain-containing protein [Sphingomicrobium sp.]
MTGYVALLRGVNLIGKSTLRMADLKAIADDLGLENATTYIASGNLVFASDRPEEKLQLMLEKDLQKHMGKDIRVVLRTAGEMEKVVNANPFTDQPGNRVQAFFLNEPPPKDLVSTVRNQADDERIATGPREVFVAYGERGIGKSRLRIPAAEAGTARNMNTVAKLAELAREMS